MKMIPPTVQSVSVHFQAHGESVPPAATRTVVDVGINLLPVMLAVVDNNTGAVVSQVVPFARLIVRSL